MVQVIRGDSGATAADRTRSTRRRAAGLIAGGAALGAAALALAACGSSGGSTSTTHVAATSHTVRLTLIGKVDANSGVPGTFTSKEHWPAFAPATLHAAVGDTVVLTIKEYDDAPTALPDGSPYNAVKGGTETVDGAPVTSVSNTDIAHTFTITALGINAPLPKAPDGGVATVVFTFKLTQAGDFTFQCMTPCGSGGDGMGGAMKQDDWMKGHLVVS